MKEIQPKCSNCGKFISLQETDKMSVSVVPDTAFTHEEILWNCKKCTKEVGKPISTQMAK